MDRQH